MSYNSSILTDGEINLFFSIATDWATGQSYSDLAMVNHNGVTYIAVQAAVAAATNEPGVGATWQTFWQPSSTTLTTVDPLTVARIRRAVAVAESAICNYINQDFAVKIHRQQLPATHYPRPRGLVEYPETDDMYIFNRFSSVHRVILKHTPVFNDNALKVFQDDGAEGGQATDAFPPESQLIQGDQFFLDVDRHVTVDAVDYELSETGILYLDGGATDFPRNVYVEYRAGLAEPKRLNLMKEILLHTISHIYQIQNGQSVSTSIGTACNPSGSQPLASESLGGYSYSVNTALQSTFGTTSAPRLIPSLVMADLHTFMKYGYIEG